MGKHTHTWSGGVNPGVGGFTKITVTKSFFLAFFRHWQYNNLYEKGEFSSFLQQFYSKAPQDSSGLAIKDIPMRVVCDMRM